MFVPRLACETSYPPDLIEAILGVKGIAYLCDEIARDEDAGYVSDGLRRSLHAYVPEEGFRGKRLLDFGCGSGASTMALARLLPDTELVAVDLRDDLLEIARRRASFYDVRNARFLVSPDEDSLPDDVGQFDFITFSAVYEHLLPAERPALLAQVWAVLRRDGILFVNQTPQRWYPHEYHTTGLPLLNYLPRRLAWHAARRFSSRVDPASTWEELLRDGIRGATEHEITRFLRAAGDGTPVSLRPTRLGFRDKVDLWYVHARTGRARPLKRVMRIGFKVISRIVREDFTPDLDLAIQKR